MPMGLRTTICVAAFLASLSPALAAAPVCDPNAAANDQARTLRIAANLPAARAATQAILKRSPDDFRANYTLGLIELDDSEHNAAAWQPAMTQLQHAATLLDTRYGACASLGWYSVYNTLGAEYFRKGRNADAIGAFNHAYAHYADLNSDTKQKLLRNLGDVYFKLGDFKNAAVVSQKAVSEKFPGAGARVTAIAVMQQRALPPVK